MAAEPNVPTLVKLITFAQSVVDVAKITLQEFLPLSFRLRQIEAAKEISLTLQAELLGIEKRLIEEAHGKAGVDAGAKEKAKLPSLPEGANLGTARSRVWPWELN